MNGQEKMYVEYIRDQVKGLFKGKRLNELFYRSLVRPISPYTNFELVSSLKEFNWPGEINVFEIKDDFYTRGFDCKFSAICDLEFVNKDSGVNKTISHVFDLSCSGVFNFKPGTLNFNILDSQSLLLKEYDQSVKKKINEVGLVSLFGDTHKFNGRNGLSYFTDVINKQRASVRPGMDAFKRFDDTALCATDIRFTLGELIVYKEYITHYLEDKMDWSGQTIYRHFPSFYDKQYWLKSGILFQLFYNFWDKIGDILAPYFAPKLKPKQIFFGSVIDEIPNEISNATYAILPAGTANNVLLTNIHSISHYQWLKSFKDGDFMDLNDKRIRVVHYTNIESEYYYKYQEHNADKSELETLQQEKEKLTDYFRKHYELLIEGFGQALALIDKLP